MYFVELYSSNRNPIDPPGIYIDFHNNILSHFSLKLMSVFSSYGTLSSSPSVIDSLFYKTTTETSTSFSGTNIPK